MITNTNTANLTMCDVWRKTRSENMINDVQHAKGFLI